MQKQGIYNYDDLCENARKITKEIHIEDKMCKDALGVVVILEAETCSTLNDAHTREQFKIFRAFANNENGRFEVVVPKICSGVSGRDLITKYSNDWNIKLDNVWTPG